MSYDRLQLLLDQIAEVKQERTALIASIRKNSLHKQLGMHQVSRSQFLAGDEELWGGEHNVLPDSRISCEYEDDAEDTVW